MTRQETHEREPQKPDGDDFCLAERLRADTLPVTQLRLSTLLLMNDQRYPWFILVPRRTGAEELTDLDRAAQNLLMLEITTISKILNTLHQPAKINVGALGNIVRQLHIHVIARQEGDAAWPGPVWGAGTGEPYKDDRQSYLSLVRTLITNYMGE